MQLILVVSWYFFIVFRIFSLLFQSNVLAVHACKHSSEKLSKSHPTHPHTLSPWTWTLHSACITFTACTLYCIHTHRNWMSRTHWQWKTIATHRRTVSVRRVHRVRSQCSECACIQKILPGSLYTFAAHWWFHFHRSKQWKKVSALCWSCFSDTRYTARIFPKFSFFSVITHIHQITRKLLSFYPRGFSI